MFDILCSRVSFTKILYHQESRVLSLAWHENGEYLVIGGMDSALKIIHVCSAICTQRITLNKYNTISTLLWDVKFIDECIVTGNSHGEVQMWDFKRGTLLNTFNHHSADVLTLTIPPRDNPSSIVFASGVDSMIVRLSKILAEVDDIAERRWVLSGKIRPHQHDVFSLHLSSTGMLASGGVDGELVITNANHLSQAYVKYQRFPSLIPHCKLVKKGNVFLFQDISTLSLWHISHRSSSSCAVSNSIDGTTKGIKAHIPRLPESPLSNVESYLELPAPICLLELKAKPPHNFLSSAISCDGCLIAVSNVMEMWIYHLNVVKRQVLLLANLPHSSSAMLFTQFERKLFLGTTTEGLKYVSFNGHVYVHTIHKEAGIKHFELNSDGRYLAALTRHWEVKLFDVVTGTFIVKLPKLQSLPLVFTFDLARPELILFVGGNSRAMFIYNITDETLRCLGKVQRGVENTLYEGRTKFSHPIYILPISFEENLFSVYDNDCVLLCRLSCESVKNLQPQQKHLSVQLVNSKTHVLCVDSFCWPSSETRSQGLIIVEMSQKDILRVLPPTLYRKRYGT